MGKIVKVFFGNFIKFFENYANQQEKAEKTSGNGDWLVGEWLRTCKKIIFHFWLAVASAGGVSKIRTTHQ